MQSPQIHLFSDGNVHVAYNTEDMSFYQLTDESWLQAQSSGTADESLAGIQVKTEHKESPSKSKKVRSNGNRVLDRLVLITTTHCNLRCRYCYAEGGTYGMGHQHMNPHLAHRALEWMLELFPSIKTVQFFGGEPALNSKTIEAVCERAAQLQALNHIEELFQYAMVTNGTFLPTGLQELIQRYRIHLTFSLDGPAKVHDANRFYVNGEGSFQVALDHFNQLRDEASLGVEMTFTPAAIDAGYGVWELAQFAQAELGQIEPHIVPVATEPGSTIGWNSRGEEAITSYRVATVTSLQSLLNGQYAGFSFLSRILHALIMQRAHRLICPAGAYTLAVDPKGDVYPCFMFVGRPELCLGNVNTRLDWTTFQGRLRVFLHDIYKGAHSACCECWAKKLCTGCAGNNLLSTGALNREWPLTCGIMKAVAEETMLFLAKIQGSAETWQRFVENYRNLRLNEESPV